MIADQRNATMRTASIPRERSDTISFYTQINRNIKYNNTYNYNTIPIPLQKGGYGFGRNSLQTTNK